MITDIEDYFLKGCGRCDRFGTPDCSVRQWADGLLMLRRICLEAGLVEIVKWGHPCYMYEGRNISLIGAFRGDFRISFMNAALLKDSENILEKPGPHSQHASTLRFKSADDVADKEPIITAYLKEAMGYAKAGIEPPKTQAEFELPSELIDALDSDPELAEAFHALTPGRQRSYVINLNSAKKLETRIARIHKFRDNIIAGKGAMER
ncbi:YdeI/OmpD-associated family protein [Ahrensia kielensis]|uniref:YdeI/OmpD-associated family protein n=1 Tax=Ahrensia kielensis TaxID=76980 RepID=UPI00037856E4|nr:YdeI/OmpD-associated family protein [Ahrensia kielensis]